MLLFGHIGLTLGAAGLLRRAIADRSSSESSDEQATRIALDENQSESTHPPIEGPAHAVRFIDWRLVIIGAILPDIIDKPIGTMLFADTFNNGRIFAHTLLFSLILLMIGIYLYKRSERTGMLIVALCSMGHLVLDSMWSYSTTLFWPLRGWEFPEIEIHEYWFLDLYESILEHPDVFVPEIIGAIIVASFVAYLAKRRSMLNFIKTGRISGTR